MSTDGTSTFRWVVRLLFVAALLVPVLGPWLGVADVPEVGSETLVRLVGLVVVSLAAAMLVRQKRRRRGQETDTDVEGSGDQYHTYAYTSQTDAAKEGDRITEEAERLAEADSNRRERR
jgi:membrane protein implicated in regulation of membrane protease activity